MDENAPIQSPPPAPVKSQGPKKPIRKPKPAASAIDVKSRAELEKEDGNSHYRNGDFVAAIKCYTRCLGYDAKNAIVLSNRAMCHIKTKEFAKAEDDCTLALKQDLKHVKSYTRRASARNGLGRHREALLDLEIASQIEPNNKQVKSEMRKTRELLKTAIKRVPKTSVLIEEISSTLSDQVAVTEEEEKKQRVEPIIERQTAIVQKKLPLPAVPDKAPRTLYEFSRFWSKFSSKHASAEELELQGAYLKVWSRVGCVYEGETDGIRKLKHLSCLNCSKMKWKRRH